MRNHRTAKFRRAFTLIEMLVVVAILGILAALLLPVLSRAREKSYRVRCAGNLKQLGLAIQLYADDHDDQLPGPMWLGVYENFNNQSLTRLPYYIATYIGLSAPTTTPQNAPLARCPSAALRWAPIVPGTPPMSDAWPLSYMASPAVTNIGSGIVSRPFGYPSSVLTTNELPKRQHEISNPALSWALTDVDELNGYPAASYYFFLPETLAHGDVRNQLCFDWHVAAVHK